MEDGDSPVHSTLSRSSYVHEVCSWAYCSHGSHFREDSVKIITRSTGSSLPCLCRETSTAVMRVGSLIGTAMVLTPVKTTTRSTSSSLACSCRETSSAFISVGRLTGVMLFSHISAAMVLTFVKITTRSTGSSLPCLRRETSSAFVGVGRLTGIMPFSHISAATVLNSVRFTTCSTGSSLPCLRKETSTAFMRVGSLKLFHMYFLSLEAECIRRRLFVCRRWWAGDVCIPLLVEDDIGLWTRRGLLTGRKLNSLRGTFVASHGPNLSL